VIGGRGEGGLRTLDFSGCYRSYVSRFLSAGTRGSILLSFKISRHAESQSRAALSYTKPDIHAQGHPMATAVLRDAWCVMRLKRKAAINTEMLNYKSIMPIPVPARS
jgi:hypothetical protein